MDSGTDHGVPPHPQHEGGGRMMDQKLMEVDDIFYIVISGGGEACADGVAEQRDARPAGRGRGSHQEGLDCLDAALGDAHHLRGLPPFVALTRAPTRAGPDTAMI